MGIQLNIKDAETVRLARSLADETGKSITETIRSALERVHAEREQDVARRKEEIMQIFQEIRDNLSPELRGKSSRELMDHLYDENGLPI